MGRWHVQDAYVGNNPLNLIDLLGLDWYSIIGDDRSSFWFDSNEDYIEEGNLSYYRRGEGRVEGGFVKGLKYSKRVDAATDLYHAFPSSFDNYIIKNGAHSRRIKDGADWFEMPGNINGTDGMYQIGVNQNGYIFHKNFVPYNQWLKY